jgi:cytochrome P450
VAVLLDLIGLPDDGRDQVLNWADGAFNAFGPDNERLRRSLPVHQDKFDYLASVVASDRLAPGSIGRGICEAANRGEIERASCVSLLAALVDAELDTTINTMSNVALLSAGTRSSGSASARTGSGSRRRSTRSCAGRVPCRRSRGV